MLKRRALCVVAAMYAAGIEGGCLAADAGVRVPVIIGAVVLIAVVVAAVALRLQRRSEGARGGSALVCVALAAMVVGTLFCLHELNREDPLMAYAASPFNNAGEPGEDIPVTEGRVLKYAKGSGVTVRLTVRAEGRKVLVSVRDKEGILDPAELVGRRIRFTGSAEVPAGRANPGCFDYRRYLLTQGVRLIIKNDAAEIEFGKKDVAGAVVNGLARLKYGMAERLAQHVSPEQTAVITGLLFGMDDDIDEDTLTMFRENGVFHILSVSGMHVAIVYAAVFALFGRRRTVFVCVCSLILLICYAALCDFSETVMRAVVMIAIHILAKLTHRRYDFLTGICAAAFLLLVVNPLSLFNAGFRLSFLAVLLLAFAVPFASRFTGVRYRGTGRPLAERDARRLGKLRLMRFGKAADYMIPAVCVQFGMTPVTASMFNILSPVALFANLPVCAVSGLLIPLGMAVLVISALPLPDIVFGIPARSLGLLTDLLTGSVKAAESLPWNHFPVPSPPAALIVTFYACAFLLMSETFRLFVARANKRGMAALVAAALIGIAAFALLPDMKQNRAALTFVDVGQGDCLHIRTPNGKNYLVDSGGAVDYNVGQKILYEYLMKNGIEKLDGVFITHLHTDHMKGITELSQLMPVGELFLSGAYRGRTDEFLRQCGTGAGALTFLAEGDEIVLDGADAEVTMRVLFPPDDAAEAAAKAGADEEIDENDSSLMLKINYGGVTALMTADLGFDAEEAILAETDPGLLKADILKVGHHGSKYSTSDGFLAAVAPDFAIIQCGRNTFGHPTREALEKLLASDIIVQRNDLDGAIVFDIRDGRISGYGTCGKTEYVTRI